MLQIVVIRVIESIPRRVARKDDAKVQTMVDCGCNIHLPLDRIHPTALMEDHECLYLC
jgi:hypothetical protein